MPTIVLQGLYVHPSGKKKDTITTATVGSSPGRVHYATLAGIPRTFERVGVDASGNEVYRDQTR